MESEENYNIEDISEYENNTFNGLILPAKSVANLSGNGKSDFEGHIISIMETQFSDEDNMISVDSCEFNRILRTRACHFLCQCLILTPQVIMSFIPLCSLNLGAFQFRLFVCFLNSPPLFLKYTRCLVRYLIASELGVALCITN